MPPVKKIVLWLLVIFFLYAILSAPAQAAGIVSNIWGVVQTGVENIFQFFNHLLA